MTKERPFRQVDVFASGPFLGNPLAVVADAEDLSDEQMARIANWTNLSETTFLLPPTRPDADYRVRIFTPQMELPFAGHPTLGSAHVWLSLGGKSGDDTVIQECDAGLIPVRRDQGRLAFAAPPRRRTGPVDPEELAQALMGLHLSPEDLADAAWADNGPGWKILRLHDRETVLRITPDWQALAGQKIGVVAPWNPARDGTDAQFEVRAFVGGEGGWEDPVTGSLNAGIAQWLIESGTAPEHYIASQGTVLKRAGRVFVDKSGDDIWIGGNVTTHIAGTLTV